MSEKRTLDAYSADITVQFTKGSPFKGKVYIQGDGNHAVFDWPAQTNTPKTTELAEFETQTKWVTTKDSCVKSKFTTPDPNFVGMVSHEGYTLTSSKHGEHIYTSGDIECAYSVDEQQREVIVSIAFPNAEVKFTNVILEPQDPALFVPPPDCKAAD